MGGRGSSGKGRMIGAGYQSNHPDWTVPPDYSTHLQQEMGIDKATADRYVDGLDAFLGIDYYDLRKAIYNNDTKSEYYEKAVAVEDFIKNSPKWAGGTVYRGIHVPEDFDVSQYKKGAVIDMMGMSSWSSSPHVAADFAVGAKKVIFVNDSNKSKNGTSVKRLSHYKNEQEVLFSNKARWKVDSQETSGKTTYVYVHEV